MEITALVISVVAGIFIGIPTGPARFFVVDSYLNNGRRKALKVYLGLFAAIVIYGVVALLTAGFLSRHQQVENISYVLGSILLICWGVFIILKGQKNTGSSIEVGTGSAYSKGFITGLSSPVTPFIYLTLIQLLKLNTGSDSVLKILIYLLVFEACSFITTFLISYWAHRNEKGMKSNWKTAKFIMGLFLIVIGSFNLYQLIEFQNGIKIENKGSFLEQRIKS